MNLDLVQIITHMVGFLIVLWVLKKMAWGPLRKVLEERRQKIASDFEAAENARKTAEQEADEYAEKLKDIEAEARRKLQETIQEGQRVAAEIKEAARQEAGGIIEKAKADLARDVAKARIELKEQIVTMTMTATERMLTQTLDDEGQRRLVREFIDEMETTESR